MSYSVKSEPAAILAKLIKISNSNTQFEFKISGFLSIISWEMELDHALVLTLDRERGQLKPLWLADSIFSSLEPLEPSGNIFWRCLNERQTILAGSEDLGGLPPDWSALIEPFGAGLAVAPLNDDKTCYGVLLLLRRVLGELGAGQNLLLEAVTSELTIAIKNLQLATETRKRISVLNVLSDLGRALSTTIDAEKVMTMIPQIASGIFLADGCTINILDDSGRYLDLASQYGLIPPAYNFERYRSSRKLPASVASALSRKVSFSGYLKDDPCALDLSDTEMASTIISCPLSFQGPHQGSISLFNKLGGQGAQPAISPRLFDRDDLELLFSMNNMISGVLENAITFREVENLARTNEQIVSYLSILHEISSAMMTTVRYDELVWIINRALTDRLGLGFDQVLILLLEEGEEDRPPTLVSSSLWTARPQDEGAPALNLAELLKTPLPEEAAQMLESGREMQLKIPVFPESPRILSRVMTEKKARLGFRLIDAENEMDLKSFGLKAYAAVPMIAKHREVGVIAVDRSLSDRPLTLNDLRDLTMLANLAGLAIENARLYDDLEQANRSLFQVRGKLIAAEKTAAQGEMGTHLAHEVRNPLVSIGGFTQRLLKKMAQDDPLRKYAEVIWEEVSRVNKVLNNVLDYSRSEAGRVRDFQLEEKVAEAVGTLRHELARKKVSLKLAADPDLPRVSADDSQVMHVVLNLIYNATQAMEPQGGGRLRVRLFETKETDESYVACEITDTGPGIPDDLLPQIFSPFFTSKSNGTGLGLSIVKKIVERYHGRIQVANHPEGMPGGGASFTFMFPAVQPSAKASASRSA